MTVSEPKTIAANCPKCGNPLVEIRYPSDSMLNRDQWESQLAGDLFCTCHNNNRGNKPYAYFWKSEFERAEPSRGAPDFLHRIEQAEQESGLTQSQENLLHDLHQYFAGGHVVLLEALRNTTQTLRLMLAGNPTYPAEARAEVRKEIAEAEAAIQQAERGQ